MNLQRSDVERVCLRVARRWTREDLVRHRAAARDAYRRAALELRGARQDWRVGLHLMAIERLVRANDLRAYARRERTRARAVEAWVFAEDPVGGTAWRRYLDLMFTIYNSAETRT